MEESNSESSPVPEGTLASLNFGSTMVLPTSVSSIPRSFPGVLGVYQRVKLHASWYEYPSRLSRRLNAKLTWSHSITTGGRRRAIPAAPEARPPAPPARPSV